MKVSFSLPKSAVSLNSAPVHTSSICELPSSYICAYQNGATTESCVQVEASADPATYSSANTGDQILTFSTPNDLEISSGTWNFYYMGVFGSTACTSGNSILSYGKAFDQAITGDTTIALDVATPDQELNTSPAAPGVGFANVTLNWSAVGSASCTSAGTIKITTKNSGYAVSLNSGVSYSTAVTLGTASIGLGPLPKNTAYTAQVNQTSPSSLSFNFNFATDNTNSIPITVLSSLCSAGGTSILTISDGPTYDFGSVNVSSTSTHSFTISNVSTTDNATSLTATISSGVFGFTGGTYPGTSGTCGSTLAPGVSCSLDVSFSPTSGGVSTSAIQVNYSNSSAQSVSRDITGTGVAGPSAPSAPNPLTGMVLGGTVTLNWSDVSGETGYKIERKPDGGSYSQIDTVADGVTTYDDTPATPPNLYWYRVRAFNGTGDSSYTNEQSAPFP